MAETISQKIAEAGLRSPSEVMRLKRMGSFFPTRLSFLRSLLRQLARENIKIECASFDLDEKGYGTSVYTVILDGLAYSMIAYTTPLADDERTDRVIAQAWDACFVLFDGVPNEVDLIGLQQHATKQEAGRYDPRVLVLSRANKSMRLFEHVAERLCQGEQPDESMINDIGYLMRTTAVYGNGKFGMADRNDFVQRPSLASPFRLEMLTVYLIREFTLDLVNHVAKARGGDKAVKLAQGFRRQLGIGNSTGLGMAPFLVGHPVLINNWMMARETALARVRALPKAGQTEQDLFQSLLRQVSKHLNEWNVADRSEQKRIETLRFEWSSFQIDTLMIFDEAYPWNQLIERSMGKSVDLQELVIALVLEPHGDLIDDLCSEMGDVQGAALDPCMLVGTLKELLAEHYEWAHAVDLEAESASCMVWYVSEEKAEPRLGARNLDNPVACEMPHQIPHMIAELSKVLNDYQDDQPLAVVLAKHPELRHICRRVQTVGQHPYGEIRDNLVAEGVRPIDLLRCKLSFFGASKFDPRSDRWTRITLYQGAPTADELNEENAADVFLPAFGAGA